MNPYGCTRRGTLHLMALGSSRRDAMACFTSLHVSTESDRQIDLSHRVCSMRCERSILVSLRSLTSHEVSKSSFRHRRWVVDVARLVWWAGGGPGAGRSAKTIDRNSKDFTVPIEIFVFWTICRSADAACTCNASPLRSLKLS